MARKEYQLLIQDRSLQQEGYNWKLVDSSIKEK